MIKAIYRVPEHGKEFQIVSAYENYDPSSFKVFFQYFFEKAFSHVPITSSTATFVFQVFEYDLLTILYEFTHGDYSYECEKTLELVQIQCSTYCDIKHLALVDKSDLIEVCV